MLNCLLKLHDEEIKKKIKVPVEATEEIKNIACRGSWKTRAFRELNSGLLAP